MRVFALCCALVATALAAEPEWQEAFKLADSSHKWIMQKVGGEYADPKMWLVMIPTDKPSKEIVDVLLPEAMELVDAEGGHDDHDHRRKLSGDGGCVEKPSGSTLTIDEHGSCFMLVVDQSKPDSEWKVNTAGLVGVALYAQHVPTEFERDMHYFKDSTGEDIEPLEYPKRWGEAIGASIIVNLMTLCGVLLLIPAVGSFYKANPNTFGCVANSFASGALTAAAFYLMLFEGSHYVAIGAAGESEVAFAWGTMVLCGVLTASIIDLIVMVVMPSEETTVSASKDVEGGAEGSASKDKVMRVRCGVLLGDFMHNFCDGIFIGTAFRACSSSLAWNITVATIAHEIAQEISDYVVLTDPMQGKLSPAIALALNFASGLSVLLGAIVVMSMEEMDGRSIGMILTFGGGIYIQIGLAECQARAYTLATNVKLKSCNIVSFCIGALAIGLVLLDHKHCETGGGHGAH